MDCKYETKMMLKDYEARKRALTNIPEQIAILEMELKAIRSATTDGTAVRGGGNKREDAMINNIATRTKLGMALEVARRWTKMVDNAMATLDDEDRLILQRMYISNEKNAVERLCEELGREKTTVYERRDKALHKLTIAMWGVEQI